MAVRQAEADQGLRDAPTSAEREEIPWLWGAKRRGRPWRTTIPDPSAEKRPNLVNRGFTAEAPDRLGVGNFTYPRCCEGRAYFGFIIDVPDPQDRRLAVRVAHAHRPGARRAADGAEDPRSRGRTSRGSATPTTDRNISATTNAEPARIARRRPARRGRRRLLGRAVCEPSGLVCARRFRVGHTNREQRLRDLLTQSPSNPARLSPLIPRLRKPH